MNCEALLAHGGHKKDKRHANSYKSHSQSNVGGMRRGLRKLQERKIRCYAYTCCRNGPVGYTPVLPAGGTPMLKDWA